MAENDEQRFAQKGTSLSFRVPVAAIDRENALHVKRVAAVGGDEVVSIQGRLLVNGSPAESPTSACGTLVVRTSSDSQPPPDINEPRVPPNRFFVAGDDLDNRTSTLTAVFMVRSMSVGSEENPSICTGREKQLELGAP